MGTSAAVIVYQNTKPEWAVEINCDGYPTDFGLWLSTFLGDYKITNGFSQNKSSEINGVANLIPRMAVEYFSDHVKNIENRLDDGCFGFYMVPIRHLKTTSFDWAYHIKVLDDGGVQLRIGECSVALADAKFVHLPCGKNSFENEAAMRLAEHGEP
jgi:hypothetical protein